MIESIFNSLSVPQVVVKHANNLGVLVQVPGATVRVVLEIEAKIRSDTTNLRHRHSRLTGQYLEAVGDVHDVLLIKVWVLL